MDASERHQTRLRASTRRIKWLTQNIWLKRVNICNQYPLNRILLSSYMFNIFLLRTCFWPPESAPILPNQEAGGCHVGTVSEFGGLEIVCNRCGSHLGRGTQSFKDEDTLQEASHSAQPMTNKIELLEIRYGCWTKNRSVYPPKWMVKIMEKPIKLDDLGVPLFLEAPIFHRKK